MTNRDRRLKKIAHALGRDPTPAPHFIAFDSPLYRDEPEALICGATADGQTWDRHEGEAVKSFLQRVQHDLITTHAKKYGCAIWLNRNHAGLPEPCESLPAYTPYPEVMAAIEKQRAQSQS